MKIKDILEGKPMFRRSNADFAYTDISTADLKKVKELLKKNTDESWDEAMDIAFRFWKDPEECAAALDRLSKEKS